jgi:hypothetical protein
VILEHHADGAAEGGDLAGLICRCSGRRRVTMPRLGRSSSAISLSTLLLPAPERPVRNTNSPGWIWNDTPASASRPFG